MYPSRGPHVRLNLSSTYFSREPSWVVMHCCFVVVTVLHCTTSLQRRCVCLHILPHEREKALLKNRLRWRTSGKKSELRRQLGSSLVSSSTSLIHESIKTTFRSTLVEFLLPNSRIAIPLPVDQRPTKTPVQRCPRFRAALRLSRGDLGQSYRSRVEKEELEFDYSFSMMQLGDAQWYTVCTSFPQIVSYSSSLIPLYCIVLHCFGTNK